MGGKSDVAKEVIKPVIEAGGVKEWVKKVIRDLKKLPADKTAKSSDRMAIAEKLVSNMVEKGQIKTLPGYGKRVSSVQGAVKPREGRLSKKGKPIYGRMRKSMSDAKWAGIANKVFKRDVRRIGTKIGVGGTATAAAILAYLLLKDKDKGGAYIVKKGDTLSEIARDNGTTLKALKEANPNIKDLNKIKPGQEINLSKKVKDRKSVYQGMTKSEMAGITKDKVVERKHGGQIGTPRGVGAALRGYGKGYK
jgi:LysM repeat protein